MEGTINFEGIKAAAETNRIEPGTIAEVKITKAEVKPSSQKGTPGLFLTFQTKEGATHTEPFWLSEKALPRVQTVSKHILGEELTGNLTYAQICAKFTDKIVAAKFIASEGSDGKYYTGMPYGSLIRPVDKIGELSFNTKEVGEIDAWRNQSSGAASNGATPDNDGSQTTGSEGKW